MPKKPRETKSVSRRTAMRLAGGAALALGGVAAARVPEASAVPGQEVVGVWEAGNAAFGTRLVIYHADGSAVATQAEPRTPQIGAWERTGDNQFVVRTLSLKLDAGMNQIGSYDLSLTVTMGADGNSYSGPLVQKEYDTTGALVNTTNTTVTATRILPVAPPSS